MPFDAEELVLVEAIHAHPKNDAPRRAYADWLAKEGEAEHAEFIRLQCHEPYIAISNRNPNDPQKSFSFDFPHDDPTANDRLARMLEIFPAIYRSDRYTAQRKLPFYEEHYRGLPLIHVGGEDRERIPDWLIEEMGHLARVDLTLCTDTLPELLSHPIMPKVDKLHIWPGLPDDADPDYDATMNSHYDRFWAENIPVLAASTIIDRLIELRLCGCHSTGKLTEQSGANLALCRELLEPRVFVEYSY